MVLSDHSLGLSSTEINLEPGDIFAHYQINQELGRGGMGIVYQAFDTKLKRVVALKVLRQGSISKSRIERFSQEAQAVAQLDHPNIVKIFDIGEYPDNYFTMEFVEGENLSHYIKNNLLSLKEMVLLLQKVAEALQVTHRKGIVHRDLKPDNIMLTNDKEPKVMDFGLVKVVDADLSQTGDILGTPVYMSPEQANGGKIDHRADVYSLGATLYQAITGRKVFQGESLYNILYQVMNNDPVAPRALNPDIPTELEAICLKCLEKNPKKRYSTIRLLGKDLKNFLENRRVLAKPPTKIRLLLKWTQRNKLFALFLFVSALTITTNTIWFIHGLAEEKKQALEQQARLLEDKENAEKIQKEKDKAHKIETEANHKLRVGFYPFAIKLADEYFEQNNVLMVNKILNSPYCPKELRHWEWDWIQSRSNNEVKTLRAEKGHHYFSTDCSFGPQGKELISASRDGFIFHWDISKQKILQSLSLPDKKFNDPNKQPYISPRERMFESCDWSPDGRFVIAVCFKVPYLFIWEIKTGKMVGVIPVNHNVDCCRFSPDGKMILTVGQYDAKVWSFAKQKNLQKWRFLGDNTVRDTNFSPDGKSIVSASADSVIKLWDIRTGKLKREFRGHRSYISSCVFSPNGKMLASGGKRVRLWDINSGQLLRVFSGREKEGPQIILYEKGHNNIISSCCFSPDNKKLISSSWDKTIRMWDIKTGKLLKVYKGHTNNVNRCSFDLQGKQVATCSDDKTVKIWEASPRPNPLTLSGHLQGEIFHCSLNQDETKLASSGSDMSIKIWNLSNGECEKTLVGHFGAVRACYFLNQDQEILSASYDGKMKLWDIKSGRTIRTYSGHKGRIETCAISPDKKYACSGGKDNTLRIWEIATGKIIHYLKKETKGNILSSSFHPNGNFVAMGNGGGFCTIWDIRSGQISKHFLANEHGLYRCAFSPDGKFLLTCGFDKTIKLWDLETIENKPSLVRTFFGHHRIVYSCAFSPDGKRIISSGENDCSVRIWDRQTGEYLLSLKGHTGNVSFCAFTKDSRKIISASEDGLIKVWDSYE